MISCGGLIIFSFAGLAVIILAECFRSIVSGVLCAVIAVLLLSGAPRAKARTAKAPGRQAKDLQQVPNPAESGKQLRPASSPRHRAAHARDRSQIYDELLHTEKRYVRDLELIVTQFIEPAKANKDLQGAATRQTFQTIFSPLLPQLLGVHRQLLLDLETAAAALDSGGLADAIVAIAPFFKLYGLYCSSFPAASQALADLSPA